MKTIGFIGAGNMASAMIGGLIQQGYPAQKLYASNTSENKLALLKQQYGIHISQNNQWLAQQVEVLILAVKPQVLLDVAKTLRDVLTPNMLIISIAAGITTQKLANCLGKQLAIVRCMPNTPALIQQGMSGLFANAQVSLEQRETANTILQCCGKTVWVEDEADINKINAISGSGPAYFFYFIEALQQAGIALGLDPAMAKDLSLQTAVGAANMAQQSALSLAELRRNVTSPGGTTEQAIKVFAQANLPQLVQQAAQAAQRRAEELAKSF